jgi:hypothetical protein
MVDRVVEIVNLEESLISEDNLGALSLAYSNQPVIWHKPSFHLYGRVSNQFNTELNKNRIESIQKFFTSNVSYALTLNSST